MRGQALRRRLAELPAEGEHAASGVQVLVTCSRAIDDALRERLVQAAGVVPARFMPERTLLFFLRDFSAVDRLAAVEGVAAVHHMQPEFKASPSLSAQALSGARRLQARSRFKDVRARWVTLRARRVTLRARWVTLRARWVTLRASLGDT